ncbi:MAG: hypothetical protein KME20_16495 [Kaiparowitsia implicata GSE-PSE-MK54-09C]|jgi:hypothetical protein|nr:hypothetical protein [Kaiparowitsia implicata GSE-PSE-MK54-09C]
MSSSLPAPATSTAQTVTLRVAIARLKRPITTALQRGYTHAEVAALLSQSGIPISANSLRYYLRAIAQPARPAKSSSASRSAYRLADQPAPPQSVLSLKRALSAAPTSRLRRNVEDVMDYLLDDAAL